MAGRPGGRRRRAAGGGGRWRWRPRAPALTLLIGLVLAGLLAYGLAGLAAHAHRPQAVAPPPRQRAPAAAHAATPSAATHKAGITYVVRSGDTLYAVGRRYGLTVDQILFENPQVRYLPPGCHGNSNNGVLPLLRPGQKLQIVAPFPAGHTPAAVRQAVAKQAICPAPIP